MVDEPSPTVRKLADVPVFNCHVYLAPPDEHGIVRARAAMLPEVTGSGASEREALRSIVQAFKELAIRCNAQSQPIPWSDAPSPPQPGEQQRWVPVHL